MKSRYLALLRAVVLVVVACRGEAHSATVVNWGDAEYVMENQNLSLLQPTVLPGTHEQVSIWGWDENTPISPVSGYESPEGKNTTFHGAGWLKAQATNGHELAIKATNWSSAKIVEANEAGQPASILRIHRGSTMAEQYAGAFFIAFLKPDFLSGGNVTEVGIDAQSALRLLTSRLVSGEIRFAILASGKWYVSESSTLKAGLFELSGTELLASNWGAWDPAGGTNGRLEETPATFTHIASTFRNIEGFGLLVSFAPPAAGSSAWLDLNGFQIEAALASGSTR